MLLKWIKKNTALFIMGLIWAVYILLPPGVPFTESGLEDITIIAKSDIRQTGGRYSSEAYIIAAQNYPARFAIDNPVNFVCDHDDIRNTVKGDTLLMSINAADKDLLKSSSAKIHCYAMYRNGVHVFDTGNYKAGITKKHQRISIAILIGLGFLILMSVEMRRKKWYYGLLIATAVAFFVLIEKGLI